MVHPNSLDADELETAYEEGFKSGLQKLPKQPPTRYVTGSFYCSRWEAGYEDGAMYRMAWSQT